MASRLYTFATPGCGGLMAIPSGTKLGSYQITGAIGAGGMGEVYQAHDTKLGRHRQMVTTGIQQRKQRLRLVRSAKGEPHERDNQARVRERCGSGAAGADAVPFD